MKTARDPNGALRLQGNLHIDEAAELRTVLLEELQREGELRLELSEVSQCDTAALQVLCALRRSAEQQGKPLHLESPSMAVRETTMTLGVALADLSYDPATATPAAPTQVTTK